jgi:hypothetical protein
MGYSSTFFIKSKVFELLVVEGYSVLRIVESRVFLEQFFWGRLVWLGCWVLWSFCCKGLH